jgi:hypothetical protein
MAKDIERKLLAELRRMTSATPAQALMEFRRRLVEMRAAKAAKR